MAKGTYEKRRVRDVGTRVYAAGGKRAGGGVARTLHASARHSLPPILRTKAAKSCSPVGVTTVMQVPLRLALKRKRCHGSSGFAVFAETPANCAASFMSRGV